MGPSVGGIVLIIAAVSFAKEVWFFLIFVFEFIIEVAGWFSVFWIFTPYLSCKLSLRRERGISPHSTCSAAAAVPRIPPQLSLCLDSIQPAFDVVARRVVSDATVIYD